MQLKSSTQDHRRETVYNFEVEGDHTYYVGESQVLVHNDRCTVAPNETIEQIAQRTGFTVEQLRRMQIVANATAGNIRPLTVEERLQRQGGLWAGDQIDLPDGDSTWLGRQWETVVGTVNGAVSTVKSAVSGLLGAGGESFAAVQQRDDGSLLPFLEGNYNYVRGYYAIGTREDGSEYQHMAVDMGVIEGTPVPVVADGTVVHVHTGCVAGNFDCGTGYGNQVLVRHNNGYHTMYAHLKSVRARIGETLRRGQLLGTSGNTGHSYGPHLHFEVRSGESRATRIDPEGGAWDE